MEAAGGDHHHLHQEEVIMGCQEQQHNIIIKGKRTKRLRPQSPIPFAIPTASSSPEDGGGGSSRGGGENDYINSATNLSPATSAEFQDSTTEEEEDMANCLILLAQGQSRAASSSPNHHHHHPHNDHNTTSRRFLEATTAVRPTVAKAGAVVYECKTCNRTFPSFQALGGHRASHKKPKANIGDDQKNKHFGIGLLPSDEEDTQLFKNKILHNNTSSSPLSLHLSNRGLVLSSNKSSSKVHECSICGAEFTSGQALGGHMRRHRAPAVANTTLAMTAPSVPAFEPQQHQNQHEHQHHQQPIKKQRSMLSLDLDLNLPAPEDDHHREPKFVLATSKQQQQPERLRTQFLVDCHH